MKFSLITRDDCSWCTKAKNLLKQHGLDFVEFNITEHPVLRDFVKSLGVYMVPQLFLGTEYIGGYTDLAIYLNTMSDLDDEG